MKIMINGIQSNLRFSSAHVIPGHESCGYIHGHSYFVDVEIEGERAGDFEFVVDFKDVKAYTKAICNELDHRLLIPVYNDLIDIKDFNKKSDSIFDLKEEKTAVAEAIEKHIPIIAVCDTNVNPDLAAYPIPANDDATKTVELLIQTIQENLIDAKNIKLS